MSSFKLSKDVSFDSSTVNGSLKIPRVDGLPSVDPGFQGNIIFDTITQRFYGFTGTDG
jgi:hypothetical protein